MVVVYEIGSLFSGIGGLEFDRQNLQWMDLKENIRKSGGKRYANRVFQKKL